MFDKKTIKFQWIGQYVCTQVPIYLWGKSATAVQYPVAGSAMPHVQLETHVELLSHVETFGFTYITQKQ